MATRILKRSARTRLVPAEPVPGVPPAPETGLPGYELIDDAQTSASRTWSSKRIAQAIAAGGGGEGGGEGGNLATVATTGSFDDLVDVPDAFNPQMHGHQMAEIAGLGNALLGKADAGHGHAEATTGAAGMMSALDKAKLDGLQGWVVLTQADYDALTPPNPGTLYIVVG
jgi:hypothetical protein